MLAAFPTSTASRASTNVGTPPARYVWTIWTTNLRPLRLVPVPEARSSHDDEYK